jgi:hypothetical protein
MWLPLLIGVVRSGLAKRKSAAAHAEAQALPERPAESLRLQAARRVLREAGEYFNSVKGERPATFKDVNPKAYRWLAIIQFINDGFSHRIAGDFKQFQDHARSADLKIFEELGDYLIDLSARITEADLNRRYDPPTSFNGLLDRDRRESR